MPRYFIDVTDAGEFTEDEVGEELAGDREARDEVISYLFDIAREEMPDDDQRTIVVVARDERGASVYQASLVLIGQWGTGRG